MAKEALTGEMGESLEKGRDWHRGQDWALGDSETSPPPAATVSRT